MNKRDESGLNFEMSSSLLRHVYITISSLLSGEVVCIQSGTCSSGKIYQEKCGCIMHEPSCATSPRVPKGHRFILRSSDR